MDQTRAVEKLGALAQENRLAIFRLLVEAGPKGLAAGAVGERLGLPGPTLSFHLAQLKQAGLIACRRDGRSLIYAAEFGAMNALIAYLTENCCGGAACALAAANEPRETDHATPAPTSRRRRA
ncbi:MAG TPA: metalloregulator ArsR/SmtB family transcription factor [Alphaproteobacteria bacterium]|nr:metalloregulator ArsR/SmtB family transcription factor [Alphaproteobacteria bacterium]